MAALNNLEQLKELLRTGAKRKLALVMSNDAHSLEAVVRATDDGLLTPILIGPKAETKALLTSLGKNETDYTLIPGQTPDECARKAAALANSGEADCIMKGKLQTGELMKVMVNREYGIRTDSVISGLGLFELPGRDKLIMVSDMAMILHPDLNQKKAIIENAVSAFHNLGLDSPKVALLAAAEKANPKIPDSIDAEMLRNLNVSGDISGCTIEGPISYDLAMDPEAAAIKGYRGRITGDADLLVVPDITAGNILAKCMSVSAKAKNAGIIVGAKVPMVVLSRSATAEDKYYSILLSAAAGRRK